MLLLSFGVGVTFVVSVGVCGIDVVVIVVAGVGDVVDVALLSRC